MQDRFDLVLVAHYIMQLRPGVLHQSFTYLYLACVRSKALADDASYPPRLQVVNGQKAWPEDPNSLFGCVYMLQSGAYTPLPSLRVLPKSIGNLLVVR